MNTLSRFSNPPNHVKGKAKIEKITMILRLLFFKKNATQVLANQWLASDSHFYISTPNI